MGPHFSHRDLAQRRFADFPVAKSKSTHLNENEGLLLRQSTKTMIRRRRNPAH